jgi:hypothetical protein
MAIAPESRTIQGIPFRIVPLGFRQARKVFVRVAQVAGPALAHLAAAAPSLASLAADAGLARAVSSALAAVSDEDLEWLAEIMGEQTTYSIEPGKWPALSADNRDRLFAGPKGLPLFFAWLGACLEVNFSGFFDALAPVRSGADPGAATPGG